MIQRKGKGERQLIKTGDPI